MQSHSLLCKWVQWFPWRCLQSSINFVQFLLSTCSLSSMVPVCSETLHLLCAFFWVIPQCLNFRCWCFGTLYLHRQVPTCLWRWNRWSVPKCRHIKFRHQGITQKKAYKIQNMVKVWNQELFTCKLFPNLYLVHLEISSAFLITLLVASVWNVCTWRNAQSDCTWPVETSQLLQ